MKTFSQSVENARATAKWLIVDAAGLPVGRIASRVAHLLRGKHKTTFTRNIDGGDNVIVLNASKVVLTGKKKTDKYYYNYSNYIGGLREQSADELLGTYPERIILSAVKGMLPRGALGHKIIKKLKVYPNAEHPHASQKPETVSVEL